MRYFARRILVTVAIVAAMVILTALIWYTFWVWLLAAAGVLLAVFLRAIMIGVRKVTHVSEGWAMAMTLALLAFAIVGMALYVAPRLAGPMTELRETLPEAMNTFAEQARQYAVMDFVLDRLGDLESEELRPMLAAHAATFVSNILSFAVGVFVVAFIGLYLAVNPRMYVEGVLYLLAPPRRPRLREVLYRTGRMLMLWLFARIVAMAFVGVACGVGLYVLGVPLPFTLGLIAGVLDFVPNIGPIAAAVPAVLIAFAERPNLGLYVIILYFVVQQIESYVVTPIVQQRVVDIPPALTVFVQVLFFVMAGILGLLMAMPITVAVIVLMRELYVRDTLGDVDGELPSEPRERPAAQEPSRANGKIVRIGPSAAAGR